MTTPPLGTQARPPQRPGRFNNVERMYLGDGRRQVRSANFLRYFFDNNHRPHLRWRDWLMLARAIFGNNARCSLWIRITGLIRAVIQRAARSADRALWRVNLESGRW